METRVRLWKLMVCLLGHPRRVNGDHFARTRKYVTWIPCASLVVILSLIQRKPLANDSMWLYRLRSVPKIYCHVQPVLVQTWWRRSHLKTLSEFSTLPVWQKSFSQKPCVRMPMTFVTWQWAQSRQTEKNERTMSIDDGLLCKWKRILGKSQVAYLCTAVCMFNV